MDIRKIAIGPDYKGGAMHYIVNPKQEVVLWKEFSSTIPVSIEYNINY